MKISKRQLHQLVTLLQSSLEKNVVGYLCYDIEQRTQLLNDIVTQQDTEVVEIPEPPKKRTRGVPRA